MGLTRKMMSGITGGTVDYRSDKERIARYTKKSLKLQKQEAKAAEAERRQAAAAATPPPTGQPQGLFGKMSAGANAKFLANASPEIRAEMDRQSAAAGAGAESAQEYGPSTDLVEGLERLTALRDSGGLTEDQFEAAKGRLLAGE